MMSRMDTRNAMTDDWMTEGAQSGPMVVTSKLSVESPSSSATWFARAVASSELVVVVRTKKPASPPCRWSG